MSLSDLSDDELYRRYQAAKEQGPVELIDRIQREICERWEADVVENR